MALIKCPECGKEISDKAPTCIHCGFPISEIKLYNVVRPYLAEPGRYVLEYENLTSEQAKEKKVFCEEHNKEWGAQNTFEIVDSDADLDYCNLEMRKIKVPDPSIIHCPKYGSTEYHAGARGFSIVTGFIGSSKTVLTCLKCGNRWKPRK